MAHYDFTMPVTEEQVRQLRVNDTVTLNGTLYGIRDATLIHLFDRGRRTRFDLRGHALIHTAPNVRWVGETQAAPTGYAPVCVGTTTSARMERFTRPLMGEYGARILIGKGGLGEGSLTAFKELGGAYLAVIGGAAALETTAGGDGCPRRQPLHGGQRAGAGEARRRARFPRRQNLNRSPQRTQRTRRKNEQKMKIRTKIEPGG
jgi:tartrate dehydratase beta subunit/fumarate hydratase class I family protein